MDETRPGDSREAGPDRPRAPACTVSFCPICTAVTTLQPVAPEVAEHLVLAAREFLLAAMALIDARPGGRAAGGRDRPIERIDIA